MSKLDSISDGFRDLILAGKDVWSSYQYAKKHKFVTCLYVRNKKGFEFKGTLTPNGKYVTPKDVNQQFEVGYSFERFPQRDTVFVCSYDNPKTVDLEAQDIDLDDVRKGHILSSIAYDLFRTSIFKYMTSQSKKELILMIAAFSALAFAFGIIIGGVVING